MRTNQRLEDARYWRSVEHELRGRGWSKKRAVAYVAAMKQAGAQAPRPGLLARLLARIRG